MDVKITVEVDGKPVKQRAAAVAGTLEPMEETIHALTQQVAAETLPPSGDQVAAPRPLFHRPAFVRPSAQSPGAAGDLAAGRERAVEAGLLRPV